MADYVYESVDEAAFEIRHLVLLPGEREDPVQGLLLSHTLTEEKHLTYEALSYTWGSEADPMDIAIRTGDFDEFTSIFNETFSDQQSVNHSRTFKYGQQSFGKISVTQNLGRALPYLRHRVEPRTLWIDAICVNQKDLLERGRQVQRMADVYRLASRAVVWLGEESDNSVIAFQYLELLSSKIEQDLATQHLSSGYNELGDSLRVGTFTPIKYEFEFMTALLDLLRRPWFGRLWIWQEIQLASEISILACGGNNSISWNNLRKVIFGLHYKGIGFRGLQSQNYIEETGQAIYKACNLCCDVFDAGFMDLIEYTKLSQCTDSKDRVYALLSLATSSEIVMKPDYTKSTEAVFQEAFVSIMNQTKSINLLRLCEFRPNRLKMPSWIDFSVPNLADNIRSYIVASSLNQLPKIVGETLETRGIQTEIIKEFNSLLIELSAEVVSPVWDGKLPEVLVRTICGDLFLENFLPANMSFPSISIGGKFLEYVRIYDSDTGEKVSNNLRRLFNKIRIVLNGRSVFVTAGGHLGLSTVFAEPGDLLVLLVGCETPLILRPKDNWRFLVVGETYCHGIMHGEPFLGPLPPGINALERLNTGWPAFRNRETGEVTCEDPRLGKSPHGWSRIEHDRSLEYSTFYEENTNRRLFSCDSDPRTFPEELEKRGVKLKSFELV